MAFIKVCGITDEKQAEGISKLGATHLGVVYYRKSPRFTDIKKIEKIKKSVEGKTNLVAVVVNPSENEINTLLQIVDFIQFHGEESLSFIKKYPKEKVIKAFRIKDKSSVEKIKPFADEGFNILIDAYSEKDYGGTGKQINKELVEMVKKITNKFILSGGLSEDNVYDLIKLYKPYGVDASSKLEINPGKKDLEKVEKFIKNANKAFEEINIE
jgi:phosphoribosylanthranilate isomerase